MDEKRKRFDLVVFVAILIYFFIEICKVKTQFRISYGGVSAGALFISVLLTFIVDKIMDHLSKRDLNSKVFSLVCVLVLSAVSMASLIKDPDCQTPFKPDPVYLLFGSYLGSRLASYLHIKKWLIKNNIEATGKGNIEATGKDNIEATGKDNIEATGKENINKTMLVAKILGCQRQKDNNSILEFELDFSEGEGNRKKELIKLDTRDLDPKIQKINPQNFKDKMIIAMPKSENCEGVIMTVINDGKLKLLSVTKGAKPGDKVG